MARKVFISFRFSDGNAYKEELEEIFDETAEIINCSEAEDRSEMSDDTIQKYLYKKLKSTSVTIILITPDAIRHKKNWYGQYDDWMYDEIRFSLEDREENRCNGIVAVYTDEAKGHIISENTHKCDVCNKETSVTSIIDFDNLFRKNMMNIKQSYKSNPCEGIYDSNVDSYCSLVSWSDFKKDASKYIEEAFEKRENTYKYDLVKRL